MTPPSDPEGKRPDSTIERVAADLERHLGRRVLKLEPNGRRPQRLEIRPVAFWDPVVGTQNEFHYMLAWNDLAERDHQSAVFQADAEWLAVRAERESRGPLVASIHNEIWAPTDFSALE